MKIVPEWVGGLSAVAVGTKAVLLLPA